MSTLAQVRIILSHSAGWFNYWLPMDPIERQFVTIMDSDTDQNLTFDLNWSLMVVPFFKSSAALKWRSSDPTGKINNLGQHKLYLSSALVKCGVCPSCKTIFPRTSFKKSPLHFFKRALLRENILKVETPSDGWSTWIISFCSRYLFK